MREKNELTERQRLFALYYAKTFHAAKSYQRAYGCAYNSAATGGSALLAKPKVREEIRRLKAERCARELLTPGDIVEKHMAIAFADIADYMETGPEGELRPRPLQEVDGTLISEITVNRDGSVKYKLADRYKSLEWLGEYLGLNRESRDITLHLDMGDGVSKEDFE